MEFKSQICTTKEQSERLLALGIKKETADMCIDTIMGYIYTQSCKYIEDAHPNWHLTPLWSLHRLIEMYSEHYVCEHINLKLLTYDTIIESIRLDILSGTFNKDYLEE